MWILEIGVIIVVVLYVFILLKVDSFVILIVCWIIFMFNIFLVIVCKELFVIFGKIDFDCGVINILFLIVIILVVFVLFILVCVFGFKYK